MAEPKKRRGIGADIGKRVLAAADAEIAGRAPAPERSELAQRGRTLTDLGSDTVYSQSRWIDPELAKPSPVNARDYDALTYEDCRDLIETLKSEGKQHTPATVRPTGDEEQPYEIVAGLRRHWAITWLRNNSYPDFKYLITVSKMDDEAAFRFSDLENRARADITDIERAKSYREALDLYYGSDPGRMADRIGLSRRNLDRYLTLADLDPIFVEAIGGHRAVKVKHAEDLTKAGKIISRMEAMKGEAEVIIEERKKLSDAGEGLIKPADVVSRLIKASTAGPKASAKPKAQAKRVELNSASGKPMLSYVAGSSRTATTIKIAPGTDAGPDEIKEALAKIVDDQFAQKS